MKGRLVLDALFWPILLIPWLVGFNISGYYFMEADTTTPPKKFTLSFPHKVCAVRIPGSLIQATKDWNQEMQKATKKDVNFIGKSAVAEILQSAQPSCKEEWSPKWNGQSSVIKVSSILSPANAPVKLA